MTLFLFILNLFKYVYKTGKKHKNGINSKIIQKIEF